uniref:EF-hand domain-containing protein n=1 Tax=Prolemur simus TaxID=1328070 RepID=A0A8C9DJF1_PROSS
RSSRPFLIAAFHKYAGKDITIGNSLRAEFLSFNTELAAFTKNRKDHSILDCMMKKLDLNCNGQLDFQEFLNPIGSMTVAMTHDSFIMGTYSQMKT